MGPGEAPRGRSAEAACAHLSARQIGMTDIQAMIVEEPSQPRPKAATAVVSTGSRKAHVVFLVSHSSAGGAQEIWANLAESFLDRGFKVELCALYPYRAEVRETSPDLAWRYILPARPQSALQAMRLLPAFVRYLRRERPDFVLSAMPAANVLGPLLGKVAGVRTRFITSHHSPAQTHNRLLDLADGVTGALRNVQTIVSVSKAVGDSLGHKPAAYRAKRQTIHNALPPRIERHIEALAASRPARTGTAPRLVATGRLARQKNYPVLLKAMAQLRGVSLDIVGSGPDEAALKALAKELRIDDKVVFHGQTSRERALEILAAGDVFVQPSLFEGHSLGLIEAAKFGLPLVVSNVPVQIEGVTARSGELCGITVDPHDDVALADAIRALLDEDGQLSAWATRARVLAQEATFERMVAAYEALVDAGASNR